ncbi:MAG: cupin domain-containing protein, partial [Desulfovibrio sp.]|nr:cupin domain-containing protein [Desulfovibrio sp.]
AGVGVPFVHSHKQNEEIYAILEGKGYAVIDGEKVTLSAGDFIRVSPAAKRQLSRLFLARGQAQDTGRGHPQACGAGPAPGKGRAARPQQDLHFPGKKKGNQGAGPAAAQAALSARAGRVQRHLAAGEK